jgi:hypothetical protein
MADYFVVLDFAKEAWSAFVTSSLRATRSTARTSECCNDMNAPMYVIREIDVAPRNQPIVQLSKAKLPTDQPIDPSFRNHGR